MKNGMCRFHLQITFPKGNNSFSCSSLPPMAEYVDTEQQDKFN